MGLLHGVCKKEKFITAKFGKIFGTDNRQEIIFICTTFTIDGRRRL
jgi:hypothetical protein